MSERHLFVMLVFVIVFSGCLSGPLPEDITESPPPITQPQPSIEELNFIPFSSITIPDIDPEFDALAPEIQGFTRIPLDAPVDVVSNDLSVIDHPRRLQILASIVSKETFLYVRPQRDIDTLIYFTVYKLNDSTTAQGLLDAYKEVWNKRPLNVSGTQIWIWDGYSEEIAGMAPLLKKDSVLYWDPQQNVGKPLTERVFPELLALSKTKNTLYSVHGETTRGEHFIMMDIKTELPDIQNKTDLMFIQVGDQLFGAGNKTAEPAPKPNAEIEADRIKMELRVLLESYLSGNMSKEEHDTRFEELNAELKNLTKNG